MKDQPHAALKNCSTPSTDVTFKLISSSAAAPPSSQQQVSRMFLKFRRIRRCHGGQLMTMCLLLSVMMVCWEQQNIDVVSHVKSFSYRYLVNHFMYLNKSLTIPREQAQSFSNFRYVLDHPDKCAGNDVLLLLFVKTSPENTERRQAIRATWGNETYIKHALGVTVKVVFALGVPWSEMSGAGLQKRLIQEDHLHGDLIQQDFIDSFHNLTLKLILQFRWMHSRCAHAHFLMTADDDIFIHMPNLVSYLQEMRDRGVTRFWVGHVYRGSAPNRSEYSKYYVSVEMYQWLSYPDYTAGAGYVVSSDVADKIYQAMLTLNASLYIDDVFMGICANAVGVTPQNYVYFSGEGTAPNHPCIYDRMITSHGHTEDIYELWTAATHPRVKQWTSGLLGRLHCTAVKMFLLCRPRFNGLPCKAAFV